jgi:hypothetical protein
MFNLLLQSFYASCFKNAVIISGDLEERHGCRNFGWNFSGKRPLKRKKTENIKIGVTEVGFDDNRILSILQVSELVNLIFGFCYHSVSQSVRHQQYRREYITMCWNKGNILFIIMNIPV